jgi:hypothetical protein
MALSPFARKSQRSATSSRPSTANSPAVVVNVLETNGVDAA